MHGTMVVARAEGEKMDWQSIPHFESWTVLHEQVLINYGRLVPVLHVLHKILYKSKHR